MTREYSASGDPQRSIELLWGLRPAPRRGPRPRLTVPQIAAEAVRLADAEGLDAVSIRRVADALGVAPMSLYTYLPGKAELLDLMLDTVYGETLSDDDPAGGWRAALERVARTNRDLYRAHPWLLQVATVRLPLGPNLIAKYDQELRAVAGIGLTDIEMDAVLMMVTNFVHGAARGEIDTAQAARHTGMTDEQWWQANGPALEKVFDAGRYPTAARVGQTVGEHFRSAYDPDHNFEFGLRRLLDGVAALVDTREPDGS